NQNAKDRTVASAWSVRPTPDARVSMPLEWEEVADCDPAAFTLVTAPARLAERGDASAGGGPAPGTLRRAPPPPAAPRRAGPAALQEAARRAAARHAVTAQARRRRRRRGRVETHERPAPVDSAAHHSRQGAAQGGRARRPRALEATASRGRGAARGRRRPRGLDAGPVVHVDADPAQSEARARARPAGRGAARSRLRSVARLRSGAARVPRAEDPLELVGGRHLQLVVAAVTRPLVRAPAHELRGVAEARTLHVIVRDLADALGAQPLPPHIP